MAEGFEEIFDYTMVPHRDLTTIFGLSNGHRAAVNEEKQKPHAEGQICFLYQN